MFSHRIEEAINHAIENYGKELKVTSNTAPLITVIEGKHTRQQKLGKFLTPFYDGKLVKELVEEFKQLNSDISEYTVSFSTDYVEVYQTPLHTIGCRYVSCMTNKDCVEAYKEDENLKLLLIHKKDILVGRTLVRDDIKVFIRLYIDHNHIKDFVAKTIVAKQGYEKGDLEGVRLSKIGNFGSYSMPYLDGDVSNVSDEGDYFLVTDDGGLSATDISGYLQMPTCSCCGYISSNDDLSYVELTEANYCDSCFDDRFTYYNEQIYNIDDCVTNESSGELVPKAIAMGTLTLADDECCTILMM